MGGGMNMWSTEDFWGSENTPYNTKMMGTGYYIFFQTHRMYNTKTKCNVISEFQPFSSHGTHKLITKILQHTKNIFLVIWEKIGIILIYTKIIVVT